MGSDGVHVCGRLCVAGAAVMLIVLLAATAGASGAMDAERVAAVETSAPTEAAADNESPVTNLAPLTGYDSVTTVIEVHANGTARWYVQYRYRLDDAAADEAFENVAANVSNPPGTFISRLRTRALPRSENMTGRDMEIGDGSVTSFTESSTGIVEYQFVWVNFAGETDDGRLLVGDAIERYYLAENETLLIDWTDRLGGASIAPEPDRNPPGAAEWHGPQQFQANNPSVTLTVTGSARGSGVPLVALAAGAVALLIVVGGATLYRRSSGPGETGHPTAGASSSADAESANGDADNDSDPDPELLSDEERVLRLLEEWGGRMRQQDLIDSVEWSRTKTSDVVNEMHEADQIEVFKLGRENVLALPGEVDV